MNAVSCSVSRWILDVASEANIPLDRLARQLPVELDQLTETERFIDWDVFATLCDSVEKLCPEPKLLIDRFQNNLVRRFESEAAELNLPIREDLQLYWIVQRWVAPTLFPSIAFEFTAQEAGNLKITAEIPADRRACKLLFPLLACAFAALPRLIHREEASVHLNLDEDSNGHRAAFHISTAGEERNATGPGATRLQKSEQHHRIICGLISDISLSGRQLPDGTYRIDWLSGDTEAVTGYSHREITHLDWKELIHPDDQQMLSARFLSTQETSDIAVYRIIRRDGEIRWIQEHGSATNDPDGSRIWHFAFLDITEQKRTEQAQRRSEERFLALIENAYDLIAEVDSAGHLEYVSPNYQEILGYSPKFLLGRSIFDLVHAEDLATVTQAFTNLSKSSDPSGPTDVACAAIRLRHKSGAWHWVEIHLARQNEDAAYFAVVTMRDVSARKRAEEALRESEEHLRQSQKMEAIGRLAGGIAHDFNNLLTAITGYCDLILDELGPDQAMRSDAEEIISAADRAGALTHQLLAFSRRQSLQPAIVDLDAIVSNVDRLLRRLIGEDIELSTSLNSAVERVSVDPGQMQQLILNLALNARDAMPEGGRLTITTDPIDVTPGSQLAQSGIPVGRYVSLVVHDTGVGIDDATAPRIFEPYFTTKAPNKGTGLGLSTVYGIVQQSGGEIRLDTEVGAYTRFRLYFPVVDNVEEDAASEAVHAHLRGGESILLVEGEESDRNSLRRCFEKYGYSVVDAANGLDALRALTENKDFDLLVTDLVLPKMNGHELAKQIGDHTPGNKTLYISGFSNEALSARFDELDEDAVLLQKPFTCIAVLSKVREILDAKN